MPKYTIWVKNKDNAKWLSIADRPGWIHQHLNELTVEPVDQGYIGQIDLKGSTFTSDYPGIATGNSPTIYQAHPAEPYYEPIDE